MSDKWARALTFAALPGAQRVAFEYRQRIEDGTPTRSFRLTSYSETGAVIGDDRDYDLLKAAMTPLETLTETMDQEKLTVTLDLKTGLLTRES